MTQVHEFKNEIIRLNADLEGKIMSIFSLSNYSVFLLQILLKQRHFQYLKSNYYKGKKLIRIFFIEVAFQIYF